VSWQLTGYLCTAWAVVVTGLCAWLVLRVKELHARALKCDWRACRIIERLATLEYERGQRIIAEQDAAKSSPDLRKLEYRLHALETALQVKQVAYEVKPQAASREAFSEEVAKLLRIHDALWALLKERG
jgi:hypothetical protein